MAEAHRRLLLSVGDQLWVDYLTEMEALRTSIGLEAYGQRDPLVQYKSRAVDMFRGLLASIRAGVVSRMYRLQVGAPQPTRAVQPSRKPVAATLKPILPCRDPGQARRIPPPLPSAPHPPLHVLLGCDHALGDPARLG